jgi:hypothetical protein
MDLQALAHFSNVPGPTVGAYVVAGVCAQCGHGFGQEWALALPAPYHALLHKKCVAFFGFGGEWPHPNPAIAYDKRRRRNSTPPLLEGSE